MEARHMTSDNPILIARGLIERHRLRAAAVAQQHLQTARQAGDPAELQRWSAVALAVEELRRTGRGRAQPTVH
jgi:hypothetical protein